MVGTSLGNCWLNEGVRIDGGAYSAQVRAVDAFPEVNCATCIKLYGLISHSP